MTWLRWEPCPLPCAWNHNAPICPRYGKDCPIKAEILTIDTDGITVIEGIYETS